MATVSIPEEGRTLTDHAGIGKFLASQGIQYERWDVESRIGDAASSEEILAAYAPEIGRLMALGGYVTADVIDVNPETPGLDAMLARFDKEHTHSEDEVRFTVRGRGVFHIRPESGPVFSVTVEAGDLLSVPAGTRHWFNLCESKTIRCIRLFEDKSGWTPHYVEDGRHAEFRPLCMGPADLEGEGKQLQKQKVQPTFIRP